MKHLDIIFAEIPIVFLRLDSFSLPLQNPVLIFSTILFIILFAPIILNKFKVPHLIGLLIAGTIIGPYGFNLIERNSAFTLFGQVGLLYIMFLAGLEIDLAEFKKNSGKSLLFGLYTFIIPVILGYVSGRYLLNFSVPSSILLSSIFASHTLISYPLISQFGVSKNRAVHIAVGGTLITDTLALLVLAVVVGSYSDGIKDHFWTQLTLSILAMGAIVMWGFPLIARWFFKRYDDNVSQYIFVLALVFLAGFLSELAGVEAIIGAFLAGLALNKLVPQTSALMNRIEFVGNALFIPFFLIGVGMLINFRVFYEDLQTLIVAGVITIAATLGKYWAAWLAQKTFKYSIDERRLLFGLSNARMAAALAVALVGYNTIIGNDADGSPIRLLNDQVLNGTIVLILITCTIATFIAQRGARNIAINDNADEEHQDTDIEERILLALPNEKIAASLVDLSMTIKSQVNHRGLYGVHIMDHSGIGNNEEKEADKILDSAVKSAAATDHYLHKIKRYDNNIVNGILGVVKEHGITDLIIGIDRPDNLDEQDFNPSEISAGLIGKCNATIMICNNNQPIGTIKRNIVLVPEKAEREIGFPFWLIKIWNISRNTGSKLLIYGNEGTIDTVKKIAKKHPVPIEYHPFSDWDDFLILGRDLREDDNLLVVMSRKNHPSYNPAMARIPYYLQNYFGKQNYIMIYPMQRGIMGDEIGDLKNPSFLEPLQDNLERLDEIGKNISALFRKR